MESNNLKYTLFYNGPFSQWHNSPFVNEYGSFNCAEQYMMFRKALMFNDRETANKILATKYPKEQKALGRQVKDFKSDIWDKVSRDVVFHGSFCKYTQNHELLTELLKTEGTILVEASPYDTIWGIGLAEDNPDALDETKWRGQNLLGYTLTNLRNQLLLIVE